MILYPAGRNEVCNSHNLTNSPYLSKSPNLSKLPNLTKSPNLNKLPNLTKSLKKLIIKIISSFLFAWNHLKRRENKFCGGWGDQNRGGGACKALEVSDLKCHAANFPSGKFSQRRVFPRRIFPTANFPRGEFSRGKFSEHRNTISLIASKGQH